METNLALRMLYRRVRTIAAPLLGVLLLGASSCTAPLEMKQASRLPMYSDVQRSPQGALAVVYQGFGVKIVGELIAVDDKRVYLLSPYSSSSGPRVAPTLTRIKRSEIEKMHVIFAQNNTVPMRRLATASYVSLFSHLFWAFVTVPVNLLWINGTLAHDLGEYRMEVSVSESARFARFPQGLPEGQTWETFRNQL
jgi:hypothetical protein